MEPLLPAGKQRVWGSSVGVATRTKVMPLKPGAADSEGREGCRSPELRAHALENSRISETSLSDGPIFKMLQKPETLNQTNDSLQ